MNNADRISLLAKRALPCRFFPGQQVRESYGEVGRIEAIYTDLQAAIDSFAVPKDWYELQERRPKTKPEEQWLAVTLPKGGVLVGVKDAEPVP